MDINQMITSLKNHPDVSKMGMIASHLGIVRGTSLDGRPVTHIEVRFHHDEVSRIINEIKRMPGIVDVLIHTWEGRLNVGDDIMFVVVGGDTREHVFPALMEAVNRIKAQGTAKKECYGS